MRQGERQGHAENYGERHIRREACTSCSSRLLLLDRDELGQSETVDDDGAGDNPDRIEEESQTVLVMQESKTRSIWSYAVEHKGASEEWVIHQVCEDLKTVGLKDDRIIIKDDQKPAITDVAKQIALNRGGRFGTALDNSQAGDSDTNGTNERAIQDVEGQCRTMRSALEEKLKTKITLKHAVTPWLIRHAGYLITWCRIRPSGRTALQMMKGRRPNG